MPVYASTDVRRKRSRVAVAADSAVGHRAHRVVYGGFKPVSFGQSLASGGQVDSLFCSDASGRIMLVSAKRTSA